MGRPINGNTLDGGWGWVVVGAVALINMCTTSIPSVFGLLFGEQLQSMKLETSSAAFLTNLNSLTLNFSGLFIGPAIKGSSPHYVAAVGCIFISFGLIICSFATEFWELILGYSIFIGLGLGMIAPSSFIAISSYFTLKRGRAVGIALAGSGVGQMLYPHIVRVLLEMYGFHTTVLLMGALALNGLIGAALFRPIKTLKNTESNINKIDRLPLDSGNKSNKISNLEIKIVRQDDMPNVCENPESNTKKLCYKIFHRILQAMDLELLKDPVFWNIIIGMGLVYTSTMNFSMLFPYFLQNSVRLSSKDTAFCMSVHAGADFVTRLLLPFLTDKLEMEYRVVFLCGTIGLFITRTVLAETSGLASIIMMSALTGIAKSATVLNNNLTISEHCKPIKLAGGLGFNMISKGMLVITIGQLFGWIRDYTGSYIICLHAQNLVVAFVIILWLPEILYKYYKNRQIQMDKILSKNNERDSLKNAKIDC